MLTSRSFPGAPTPPRPAPRSPHVALGVLTAGLLAVSAVAAAPAHGASSSSEVDGGSTTITPRGSAARALDRADVRIRATGKGARAADDDAVRITVAKGRVGTGSAATVLRYERRAGLLLRGPDGRAKLTDLRLKLGKHSRLTGRINGHKRQTLFTLKASKLRVAGQTASRASAGLRLTRRAARDLRRRLDVSRLRAGTFARVAIAVDLAGSSSAPTPAPSPPPPGAPVSPSARPIVAGTVDWGLKASFRAYITGFAHGKIVVADGAVQNADGSFRFGAGTGSYDPATGATVAAFRGTVYFEGHGSGASAALRLWVRNPTVVITAGGTGTLYADVTSRSMATGAVQEYPAVPLGALEPARGSRTIAGAGVVWTGIPVTLTEAGVPAFASFYNPGETLDPIGFSLAVG